MRERWRHVVGYKGLYEVSDYGRVRSRDRVVCIRSDGRERLHRGRVLRGTSLSSGYVAVALCAKTKGKRERQRLVHRLVAEAFLGVSKKQINHKNFIRADNRLKNLEYVTSLENIRHAIRRNRFGSAKLTVIKVRRIRDLCKTLNNVQIGKVFNVDASMISRIRNRRSWCQI